ncbi:hypothetical protein [Alkalihalobacillus sp. AL-G]|uniref:hypothetical protein n=1 Tax=Alkalihalobacillus sp. AL-G TaxID=2926399 RepID=UPI00272BB714|nr:hypothetical protein [Alkalihalobacillus sp. AL-G]WLD94339.1 hypothetical protein MOJ78_05465 [Alkalihalobacillus sp. AL-G]
MKKIMLLPLIFVVLIGCSPKKKEGISKDRAEEIVLEHLKKDGNIHSLNADSNDLILKEHLNVFRTIKDKKWNVWFVMITTTEGVETGNTIAEFKVDMDGKIAGIY